MRKSLILPFLTISLLSPVLHAAEEIDLFFALTEQDWLKAVSLLDSNPKLLNKQGEEEFEAFLGDHPVDSLGKTPLVFAVEYKLDLMAVNLLDYGADPEARDSRGWTPLMIASYRGNYDAARLLLAYGAQIDVFDREGLSPLALAVGACRFETADLLLEQQANLYDDIPGAPDIVQFIYRKKIEVRDTLRILDRGAPAFPLFEGVEQDDYARVRTMLLQGMYPDGTDSQGVTPLIKAASLETPYMTELLLNHGADPNHREIKGLTPLSTALYHGRRRQVEMLLDAGADVNRGNTLEETPLFFALLGGHADLTELLIDRGAMVSRRDYQGRTALMYAAFLGDWSSVKSLLKGGALSAAMDGDDRNAVFYAMDGYLHTRGDNYYTIVDRLIEEGASSREYLPMAGGNRRFYELLEARWRD